MPSFCILLFISIQPCALGSLAALSAEERIIFCTSTKPTSARQNMARWSPRVAVFLAAAASVACAFPIYGPASTTPITFRSVAEDVRSEKPFTMRFIHTNDIHSRFDEFNTYYTDCTEADRSNMGCFGGAARQKYMIDKLRKESPHPTMLLDAGDQFQGTLFYSYYKGNTSATIMNLLGYNAMAIGNHEFDDKVENIERVASGFNFPLICANIDLSAYPHFQSLVKPHVVFPEHSLGIIGFITPLTADISIVGDKVTFENAAVAVQRSVDILKKQGIKRIIAVSHNGYVPDQEVAKATTDVSLIIGGHSHTLLDKVAPIIPEGGQKYYPTNITNKAGRPTYIVQASWAGKYIGNLTLSWSKETNELVDIGGAPILLDQSVPQDPEIQKMVADLRTPFEEYSKTVIGKSNDAFLLDPCREGECPLGNLINDATEAYRPQADFSFTNVESIRASLPKGQLTRGDALAVFPFGNIIVEQVVQGQFIIDLLENAFSKSNQQSGKPISSFIAFGGATVVYDPSGPKWKKLISVNILDRSTKPPTPRPIVASQNYTIITNDFVANGGDAMVPYRLKDAKLLSPFDEAFSDYLAAASPLTPYVDGRLRTV